MFGLINFSSCLKASTLPPDLRDLKERWEGTKMIDNGESYINISELNLEDEQVEHSRIIFEESLKNSTLERGAILKKVNFEVLEKNVRKKILKKLFHNNDTRKSFCSAYPHVEMKFSEDEVLSDEEKNRLEDKANLSRCKRDTENMLGGILFANPRVYLFSSLLSFEGSSGKVIIYVNSMIDSSKFLRYSFML